MSESVWHWYVGACEDEFTSQFETKEEAIYCVQNEYDYADGAYIIYATHGPAIKISHQFDANYFLENAEDNLYEYAGPDGDMLINLTTEQIKSFQFTVREAIDKWQEENSVTIKIWTFHQSKHLEFIKNETEQT